MVNIGVTYNYYAVYSRVITFYSGLAEATKDGEETQYYNSSGIIKTIDSYTPVTITGWTKLGYRGDTTADDETYSYGTTTSIKPAVDELIHTDSTLNNKLWAVYKRTLQFYTSSIDTILNDTIQTVSLNTDPSTREQYYNSHGTVGTVKSYDPTELTGWTTLGWRNDTTASSKEYDKGTTTDISPAVNESNKLYSVYSKGVTAYSGIDGAFVTHTGTLYYNSYDVASTLILPSESSAGSFDKKMTAVSNWTFTGWSAGSLNETTNNWELSREPNSLLFNSSLPIRVYAQYSRTIEFKSGLDGEKSHTSATQTYQSKGDVSEIDLPTSSNTGSITNWTKVGWRYDTTPAAAFCRYVVLNSTTCSPPVTSGNILYAVYSRDVTFKSGSNGSTTHSPARTQYYNSANVDGVSNDGDNVSAIDVFTATSISNWEHLGWSSSSSATVAEYPTTPTTTSISPYATTGNTMYAVYSRGQSVMFYSGLDGSKELEVEGEVIYASGSSIPTHITLNVPTAEETSDITNWREMGYRSDATATSQQKSFGGTITVEFGGSYSYYAVYARYLEFVSGVDEGTVHTPKRVQYYNSANTDSAKTGENVSGVTTFTAMGISSTDENDNTSGWYYIGWRDDVTPDNYEYTGSTISPLANADFTTCSVSSTIVTCRLYAVYDRTMSFMTGLNTEEEGATEKDARTQYYNSYDEDSTLIGENVDQVSTFTPTKISDCWIHIGWNDDSATLSAEYPVDNVGPYATSGNILYAVYERTIVFKSGINGATTHSPERKQYYNSGKAATQVSPIDTFTPNSITGWTPLGWRGDTSASGQEYASATSITPDANKNLNCDSSTKKCTIYAVYDKDGTAVFYHGENKVGHTDVPWTAYYNSNATSLPTSVKVTSPTKAQNTDITGWTELGYRNENDTSSGAATIGFANSNTTVTIGGDDNFYAVYSNTYTVNFWHGINKAGNAGDSAFKNQTVYYNTATASVPTTVEITTPAKTALTDIGNGWDAQGYATTTSSFTVSKGFGVKVYPSIGITTDYYAVYKRSLTFKSGYKGSVTTHTPTRDQYYNSGGAASNVSSVNTFTAASLPCTTWVHDGWQDSNDVEYYEAVSSISPPANAGSTILAYYEAEPVVWFYHGEDGVSTSTYIPVDSTLVSYTTNTTTDPAATTTVKTPSKESITDIGSGWNKLGFRTDDSSSAATVGFGVDTSIILSNTLFEFFAIYDVTETAKLYHGENGDSDTTCTTDNDSKCRLLSADTVYYNSRNESPTSVANIQMPGYDSLIDIESMYPIGYRTDTQNTSQQYVEGNFVPVEIGSDTKFYTIYYASSGMYIWDGVNDAWDSAKIGEVYYNSSTNTAPTTIDINVPTEDETQNITSWNKKDNGYYCDANMQDNDFGAAVPVPINNTTNCYAFYTRNVETWFYVGLEPSSPQVHYFETKYYSSDAVLPTTAQINLLTEGNVVGGTITNWKMIGWRDDSGVGNKEYNFGQSVTARLDIINAYYAAYERKLKFVSGENKPYISYYKN